MMEEEEDGDEDDDGMSLESLEMPINF